MNRVLFVLASGLALAGCSSMGGSLDFLKPGPQTATLQLESQPAGAEARVSVGGSCRTPCSLPVTADSDFTVTFTLAGRAPATVPVELIRAQDPRLDPAAHFDPNPVAVELEAAGPVRRGKAAPAKKPRVAAKRGRAPAAPPDDAEPEAPATPFPPAR